MDFSLARVGTKILGKRSKKNVHIIYGVLHIYSKQFFTFYLVKLKLTQR